MLVSNDLCFVRVDYLDKKDSQKRVQLIHKQQNGNMTFWKVLWRTRDSIDMAAKYGTLFTEDELRKV